MNKIKKNFTYHNKTSIQKEYDIINIRIKALKIKKNTICDKF